MNEFLAKPVTLLRTLQDQSNAIKVLISEASKDKFLFQLSGDLDAFSSQAGEGHQSCRRVSHVSASAL